MRYKSLENRTTLVRARPCAVIPTTSRDTGIYADSGRYRALGASETMSELLNVLLIGKGPGNLEGMLRECGREIELVHCKRANDGIALASGGGIDIVLLDLVAGRGVAVFDRLRRMAPGVPVIVLTAAIMAFCTKRTPTQSQYCLFSAFFAISLSSALVHMAFTPHHKISIESI